MGLFFISHTDPCQTAFGLILKFDAFKKSHLIMDMELDLIPGNGKDPPCTLPLALHAPVGSEIKSLSTHILKMELRWQNVFDCFISLLPPLGILNLKSPSEYSIKFYLKFDVICRT